MHFSRDGARHCPSALEASDLARLEQALQHVPAERAGERLIGNPVLSGMLAGTGAIGRAAAEYLGSAARPVRALLFNKTAATNWSLAWHQDRTIAVRERVETEGFTNWTVKSGIQHVEPPFELLEHMLTLRVHLDAVGPGNAPLLIVPGSHRLGRISEDRIADIAQRHGCFASLAERGDIWLYATPILHASDRAADPRSRRVLQIDYSADGLPGGLEWRGI